jgi:hypothetical protein
MPHPTTPQLRAMIKQAMQDRAPKMYQRLLAADRLEQEIDDRVSMFEDAEELALKALDSPSAPTIEAGLMDKAEIAQEQALAIALKFPTETDELDAPA